MLKLFYNLLAIISVIVGVTMLPFALVGGATIPLVLIAAFFYFTFKDKADDC